MTPELMKPEGCALPSYERRLRISDRYDLFQRLSYFNGNGNVHLERSEQSVASISPPLYATGWADGLDIDSSNILGMRVA